MRDWAFVTRPNNWAICQERRVFGFDAEYRETVTRYLSPGDRALVWVTLPIGGVAAVISVTDVSIDQQDHIGWLTSRKEPKLFPDRVHWEPLRIFDPALGPATARDFFDRLQFIADKRRYNIYLQVALIRVAAEDVELALSWPRL